MTTRITNNLSRYKSDEKGRIGALLIALSEQGLPDGFADDGLTIVLDENEGTFYFRNSKEQRATLNGEKLEQYYITPYNRCEGFADELRTMYQRDRDLLSQGDIDYLLEMGIIDSLS